MGHFYEHKDGSWQLKHRCSFLQTPQARGRAHRPAGPCAPRPALLFSCSASRPTVPHLRPSLPACRTFGEARVRAGGCISLRLEAVPSMPCRARRTAWMQGSLTNRLFAPQERVWPRRSGQRRQNVLRLVPASPQRCAHAPTAVQPNTLSDPSLCRPPALMSMQAPSSKAMTAAAPCAAAARACCSTGTPSCR